MLRFDFGRTKWWYQPYPVGLAADILPMDTYLKLVEAFPPPELAVHWTGIGNKYTLSHALPHTKTEYGEFLRTTPIWAEFYRTVSHPRFLEAIGHLLKLHHIDLGFDRLFVDRLRSRFEFSFIPSNGGHIVPHTDRPQKLCTLVYYMVKPGDWTPEMGGGFDMLQAKDPAQNFSFVGDYDRTDFTLFNKIRTFPFQPNQCVLFIKTFNSWHSVGPLPGATQEPWRRSVTINIETYNVKEGV